MLSNAIKELLVIILLIRILYRSIDLPILHFLVKCATVRRRIFKSGVCWCVCVQLVVSFPYCCWRVSKNLSVIISNHPHCPYLCHLLLMWRPRIRSTERFRVLATCPCLEYLWYYHYLVGSVCGCGPSFWRFALYRFCSVIMFSFDSNGEMEGRVMHGHTKYKGFVNYA